MYSYPYNQNLNKDILEIVDAHDKPFLLQSHKYAQHLPHRTILLLVQDHQNKLLMWRNHREKNGCWDFLHGYVRAGEAREHTLLRLVERYITPLAQLIHNKDYAHILENMRHFSEKSTLHSPQKQKSRTAQPTRQHALGHTTFFVLQVQKKEKAFLGKDVLWLDFDELQGFATHFSDMLGDKALKLISQEYLQKILSL